MRTSRRSRSGDGPHDPVTSWARDVVGGRIVAGELTRYAAERHLRDLKDGPRRGLHWDQDAALHVIDWFPAMLTITAGAKSGEPFHLLPHTLFATGSLFGWRRSDGKRRFRTCWMETGKGQAKSPWMAAVGLYMLRFSGVPRAEVYAVAGNEDQAGVIIGDAASLCRANVPGEEVTLAEKADLILRGTGDLTWQIEWDGSDYGLGISKFRNVSSGSKISGPRPILVLGDEVHEWKDEGLLNLWMEAIRKQPADPLFLLGTNTPAPDQIVGTDQSDYYAAVAKGDVRDDSSLGLIFRCDETDDPLNDEAVWPKALPALGITYPVENIRDGVAKARHMPGAAASLKRLYFGIPGGVSSCWIEDYALWERALGTLDDDELLRLPCWLGLDLSSRKDLTALAAVWVRPNGHLLARIYYWTPGETLLHREKLDRAPYSTWVDKGFLTATPGPTIPKVWPATETKRIVDHYEVEGMAYDPAQILDFEEACREIGLKAWRYEGPDKPAGEGLMMVRHGQGWKGLDNPALLNMPTGVKALEEAILGGNITIEDNPVTTWCSANMTLVPGANPDQRVPDRRKARGRIDGMVALIEAVNAARSNLAPKPGASVYETRGLLTL